jgi:hypothetical protein
MKANRFLLTFFICGLSLFVAAQKSEIKLMYSPLSLIQTGEMGSNLDNLTSNYTGAFMIDYNRYLKPRIKIGINVTYDQGQVSGTTTQTYRRQEPPYDIITTIYHDAEKDSYLFFGPQISIEYIQKDNFHLGSLVGLSMVLYNWEGTRDSRIMTKGTDVNVFFHAELINFTLGNRIGLTGQLGYGQKGIVSLGFFCRW